MCQQALLNRLGPIFEPVFDDANYGYRQGRSTHGALRKIWRELDHVLTPGRYVGAAPQEDDGEPFEDKMKRLVTQLREQHDEGAKLDKAIEANLKMLGFLNR